MKACNIGLLLWILVPYKRFSVLKTFLEAQENWTNNFSNILWINSVPDLSSFCRSGEMLIIPEWLAFEYIFLSRNQYGPSFDTALLIPFSANKFFSCKNISFIANIFPIVWWKSWKTINTKTVFFLWPLCWYGNL